MKAHPRNLRPVPAADNHARLVRIDAAAVADGAGLLIHHASILLQFGPPSGPAQHRSRLLAVGPTSEVAQHEACTSLRLEVLPRPGAVLIPGLVNAHTHLDLTHLGPCDHDPTSGFVSWVDRIRAGRCHEPQAIADAVRLGLRLSLAAGTVAIGDIAGAPGGKPSLVPWRTMNAAGVRGVSYLEFFGIGRTAERSAALLAATLAEAEPDEQPNDGVRLGLQPHAPNTVARPLYARAMELAAAVGRPVATHLAETPEEREFVSAGRGPQRALLERLGVWDDAILHDVAQGLHPVAHLAEVLASGRLLAAHVNDADDAAVATLARTGTSVAYCPHASAYFGADRHFGPHRYPDMLAAGVNVCLGTDSIVNLPSASEREPVPGHPLAEGSGLSVFREMALLHQRDGADPGLLLRMATLNGARALGMDDRPFRLAEGQPIAGLLAAFMGERVAEHTHPLGAALTAALSPEVLFADNPSGLAGTLSVPVR